MQPFRRLIAQRRFALLVCAVALLLKLLIPNGYMIGVAHGRVAVTVCPGAAPAAMAMPGMHGDMADHGRSPDRGGAEMPCAFATLSAAALGAIDPVQLAALVAFVLAIGMVATVLPSPIGSAHLRPPLRGPPPYP